ncbi:MAG: hypothetical protein AAFM91_06240 [Pseudomonadota bacterium]
MTTTSGVGRRISVLLAAFVVMTSAHANLPVQLIDVVADDGQAAPVVVPVSLAAGAEYRVTITDFGVESSAVPPAASIQFALVNDADSSTPLTAASVGEQAANIAAGDYRALLIVVPDATAGRASVGVRFEPTDGSAVLIDRVDAFETVLPAENPTAFDLTFTVPADGDYEFIVNDLAFPDALSGVSAIAIRLSDSSVLGTLSGSGTIALNSLVASESIAVSLVATRSDVSARSSLGYRFAPAAGGADVAAELLDLGDFSEVRNVLVPAAPSGAPLTLTVTNFGNVNALSVAAIDPATNTAVVQSGAGSTALNGTGDPLTLRVAAAVGATGGVGVLVRDAASDTLLEDVVALQPAATVDGFAVIEGNFTVPAAGDVTVNVRDFAFPQSFASVNTAVVRDGAIVASTSNFGPLIFAADSGEYFVTVVAVTTNPTDAGLVGLSVDEAAGGSLLQTSAAAGGAIRTIDVAATSATTAVVELTDLDFPASFSQLSAVVTQGADLIGTLLGGGTFEFDVVPGSYQLNVIATPQSTTGYASFNAIVDERAPLPVVTFGSDTLSVATGGSVTLSWDSSDATACTASGAWLGARPTSGTEDITNITAERTFTLTCDGPGGSDVQSLTVSVQAAGSVSSGGGPLGPVILACLGVFALARRASARRSLAAR